MSEIETLGVLEEIQSLVSDKLQVVSYKWLSRNFLLSSNAAKRLLQDFVHTHGSGLQVVYTLSGWLKNNPTNYHVRLVSGPKLEEAKEEFNGNCSIHVYSVQASIPKDPAALWNTEFVQAEELFKQPPSIDNCLRDNRFCGIANSFVTRNVDGSAPSVSAPQPKFVGAVGTYNTASTGTTVPPSHQSKAQSSPKVGVQFANVVKDVKTESNSTGASEEKALPLPADKRKGQSDKSSSGNGGSLANMWGRASANSKVAGSTAEASNLFPNPTASAEAQICAREAIEDGSSDEEAQNINFKRASTSEGNRKRRVVLHYSDDEDEDEDAANLSSPDLPKVQGGKTSPSKKPNLSAKTEGKPMVKEEISTEGASNRSLMKDSSAFGKNIELMTSMSEKTRGTISGDDLKENRAANAASTSPKRRKVLKTRIDERGREVTEVVWEGEEIEEKKVESDNNKKPENSTVDNAPNNRAPVAAKKSPAVGNTAPSNQGGKAANKKGGNKDPKQGNILSFFKRV